MFNKTLEFFNQKEIKEIEEFDSVREQLESIKENELAKKIEEDKNGFFATIGESISSFFNSIGSFFTNLF